MIEKTMPKKLKGIPLQQQKPTVTEKMPTTKPATANPLFLEREVTVTGAPGTAPLWEVAPPNSNENSGSPPSVVQSEAPSRSTRVVAIARPSAIHCRNCSAEMGPYSLPSAPMILYITRLW